MQQYHKLLQAIQSKGTYKPPARENMPGTTSLFGYQFRHDMSTGFPLITTKKMWWKGVVIELLWFLRGDTNIKYLVDNGVNIWNEDAYNYYVKRFSNSEEYIVPFIDFLHLVKTEATIGKYTFGDCGAQYGKLWRAWGQTPKLLDEHGDFVRAGVQGIDQIQDCLDGLINNPMSRRHIVTAWNPSTLNQMALNACHCLMQFNCRPLTALEREKIYNDQHNGFIMIDGDYSTINQKYHDFFDEVGIPKYYLDLQLYQRSADVFLGVPFNIASYALLLQVFAETCNMIPREFIHTFGDVHIYDNHKEQVAEQLSREVKPLPEVEIHGSLTAHWSEGESISVDDSISHKDFKLVGYESHPAIRAELSTGLVK